MHEKMHFITKEERTPNPVFSATFMQNNCRRHMEVIQRDNDTLIQPLAF
jgi:hypothetical protein